MMTKMGIVKNQFLLQKRTESSEAIIIEKIDGMGHP
jgi:hypothetical protein